MRRLLCLLVVPMSLLAAPAAQAVTGEQLGRLIDVSLEGLLARQQPWGGFDDPLAGPTFNYGAVGLGWLAVRRATPGPEGDAWRRAAALALQAGTRERAPGAYQTWMEALAMTSPADRQLDATTRAALSAHLVAYVRPAVGPGAQACAANPDCYSNLKLVDAVGSLQLARTGLRSATAGSRLADPAATELLARRFMASRVPRAQRPELRLRAGALTVTHAALLSDPARNPLAYHALSSAMLLRAVRMLGTRTPPVARLAAQRALWALVALADPQGDVTWMGRGQQNVWTYAASVYAAVAGAAEFGEQEPALAARLRRLADVALAELERRRGEVGLALGPGPRRTLAGMDKSTDTIAANGLALIWLQLAAAEAEAAAGPSAPIPAHIPGAVALDPIAAGVATVRAGRIWLAVHQAATHPRDARYDVGLLAALVRDGAHWRPVVGQRPNTHAARRAPSSGPLLVTAGRILAPSGRLVVRRGAVTLRGAWRAGRRRLPARWRYEATSRGVRLRTPCPMHGRLRLIEWIPAVSPATLSNRGVRLPDRTITVSAPVRAARLAGLQASAAYERLAGVQLEIRCSGRPVTVSWHAH